MKTLNDLFSSKKGSKDVNVSKIMFDVLKSGKKFSRNELKIEMFKVRFEMENGIVWDDKFLNDVKYKDVIEKLGVKSRNSIDTFISKNNRELLFVDFGINNKMECKGDVYFLNVFNK